MVRDAGRVAEVKAEQPLNALKPMVMRVEGNVSVVSFEQFRHAALPTAVREAGRVSSRREIQPWT